MKKVKIEELQPMRCQLRIKKWRKTKGKKASRKSKSLFVRTVLFALLLFLLLFPLCAIRIRFSIGLLALALVLLLLLLFLLFLGLCLDLVLLLRRNKVLFPLLHLLLALLALALHDLLLARPLLGLLAEEVLARLDLQVDLALLLRWWERRVDLLRLVGDLERLAALGQGALLEVRQEAVPGLVGQRRVLGQLPLDHQLLDVVDGVDVVHAVLDHAPNLLKTFVGTHRRDRVALDEDVGAREELEGFKRRAVGAKDTLATLDEALLVAHKVADLDNVACDAIFENFYCLEIRKTVS